jgi:RNA polymerase sigma-70 factor (ECF subfamily)
VRAALEDRELVQKLLDKSEEAERYFFHAYREKLYRTSVYILGHHDPEAEDVVQEAFMVALRKLPEFEFRSSLNRWLFRICVFLCYERIRKRKRQVLQLEAELENLSSAEQERWKEGDDRRRNALQLVREQRELMGEPCKGLLRLWDEENQSYALIAETLKIPIGTVMSRLNRCKEDLKQLVLRVIKEESNA